MKKILYVFVALSLSFSNSFAQDFIIKSLKVHTKENTSSIPVLSSPRDQLVINFDVQSEYPPNINITFKFCDRNWNPVDNIFLSNQGKNTDYNLNYISLPTTIEDAKYHYQNHYPDKEGYVIFPFSGKWKFFVVDSQDPSIVYSEGKFFVIKAEVPLEVEMRKETLEDKTYFPPQLGHTNWFIVDTEPNEKYFTFQVDEVEIVQNHLMDYSYRVSRNSTDQNRVFEWDGANKLRFIAKDVRPGNEYREVDLMDNNVYIGKNVKAQFDGLEYSRFLLQGNTDMNGGFKLKSPKDIYSNYMNVKFQLRPAEDVYGDFYLVGAFNDWKVSPAYKLNFNGDFYDLTIPLKRGVYDYQYVVVNGDYNDPANQDWYKLEGNDWQTKNEYNIFLWYRDQENGGYDRIIGYTKIESR
ncbi:MAG: type IX secretion system plug protein domain-containing protein [Ignavibacteriaceae bacterium]